MNVRVNFIWGNCCLIVAFTHLTLSMNLCECNSLSSSLNFNHGPAHSRYLSISEHTPCCFFLFILRNFILSFFFFISSVLSLTHADMDGPMWHSRRWPSLITAAQMSATPQSLSHWEQGNSLYSRLFLLYDYRMCLMGTWVFLHLFKVKCWLIMVIITWVLR